MADNGLPEKVLLVDDDPAELKALENALAKQNIKSESAKDWESALYLFNQQRFDLAIVELEFAELPGLVIVQKFLTHELESKRNIPHILAAGRKLGPNDQALMSEIGNIGIVNKPVSLPQLLSVMVNTVKNNTLRRKISEVETKIIEPLLKQGNLDKALKVAQDQLLPLGPRGQMAAAKIMEQCEQPELAVTLLRKVSTDNPQDLAVKNILGRILLSIGDFDSAQTILEEGDKVAPNNLQRIESLAEFYLKTKQPEKSIEKFKQLIDLFPEEPGKKFDYVEQVHDAGFAEEAQQFCNDVSTPMELIRHYNNKGVLFSKQERYIDAIDEYKKAQRFAAHSKEIYRILYNMAIANINLKNLSRMKDAEELLLMCLENNKNFTKAKEKLALVRNYLGEKQNAS